VDQHSDSNCDHFLLRCNSDVTSLLSGTAIRSLLLTYQTMSQSLVWRLISFLIPSEVYLLRVLKCLVIHRKERQGQESFNKNCQCSYCQVGDWWSYGILVPSRESWSLHWQEFCCILLEELCHRGFESLENKMVMYNQTRLFFWKMLTVNLLDYQQWMITYTGHMKLSDKSLYEWIQIYTRLKPY